MKILAATGHRPDKLGGYNAWARTRLTDFVADWLRSNRPDVAISGMAQGFDTAFATACIHLHIPLTAAVPFVAQPQAWPQASRDIYHWVLSKCTRVVVLSPDWATLSASDVRLAMHLRNKWMVDNSTDLIALWNGSPGGTKHCIEYAEAADRTYGNLWHQWLRWPK